MQVRVRVRVLQQVRVPVQALLTDSVFAPARDPCIADDVGMAAGIAGENSLAQVRRMVASETCKESLCRAS